MSARDDLAALIFNTPLDDDPRCDPEPLADAILARYRLASNFECQHRGRHHIEPGQTECCGQPLIPWSRP